MSKRIHVTLAIEVEDDDYVGEIQQALASKDYEFFSDWIVDLVHDVDEDYLTCIGIEVHDC